MLTVEMQSCKDFFLMPGEVYWSHSEKPEFPNPSSQPWQLRVDIPPSPSFSFPWWDCNFGEETG